MSTPTNQPGFYGKGSIVVPSDDEGAVRRLAITADRLVTQPILGIDVIPDVIAYAARTHGSRDALGWRNVVRIHEEKKEVKKTVGGKEVTETKTWTYWELSDFEYISFLDVYERVVELARGLVQHGILKTDVFNIYAQTRCVVLPFSRWALLGGAALMRVYGLQCELAARVACVYDDLDARRDCI